mmetsp:Transcript_40154/g.92870  ORF Transcript_40154/g.92870 Transcript_40154/m.92870 type:complete len:343 (+) Transcript_40154:2281-3309(+)
MPNSLRNSRTSTARSSASSTKLCSRRRKSSCPFSTCGMHGLKNSWNPVVETSRTCARRRSTASLRRSQKTRLLVRSSDMTSTSRSRRIARLLIGSDSRRKSDAGSRRSRPRRKQNARSVLHASARRSARLRKSAAGRKTSVVSVRNRSVVSASARSRSAKRKIVRLRVLVVLLETRLLEEGATAGVVEGTYPVLVILGMTGASGARRGARQVARMEHVGHQRAGMQAAAQIQTTGGGQQRTNQKERLLLQRGRSRGGPRGPRVRVVAMARAQAPGVRAARRARVARRGTATRARVEKEDPAAEGMTKAAGGVLPKAAATTTTPGAVMIHRSDRAPSERMILK